MFVDENALHSSDMTYHGTSRQGLDETDGQTDGRTDRQVEKQTDG